MPRSCSFRREWIVSNCFLCAEALNMWHNFDTESFQWVSVQRREWTTVFGLWNVTGHTKESSWEIWSADTYFGFEQQLHQVSATIEYRHIAEFTIFCMYIFSFLCYQRDLSFLSSFKTLHTLILDNNTALNEVTLPYLPSLRILW